MKKPTDSPLKTDFHAVISALLETSKPFPANYLSTFSDLDLENLRALLKAWPKIGTARKLTLLEDLKDLEETDTLTCFDTLGKALLEDPDPKVRMLAINLLSECEDRKLVPLYLSLLKTDEAEEVRAATAEALGSFVDLGELEKIPAQSLHEIEDALLETISKEKSILVRQRALVALGASSRPEVPGLIEEAVHQKKPDWVISALTAMGRSSDEQWEKHILSRLRNPNDDIRIGAIDAAGEIGIPTARKPLLDILEDEEDLIIRRQVITALSKIGGEGVRAALEELLEYEDDDEEIEFLEDALGTLVLTDEAGPFGMFNFDPDQEFHEDQSEP